MIRTSTVDLGSTKFVFVTGGVVSSLGKGLAASSMGALLKSDWVTAGSFASWNSGSRSVEHPPEAFTTRCQGTWLGRGKRRRVRSPAISTMQARQLPSGR